MPRQSASFVENNFKAGLVTDSTGLNFPENACTDSLNCIHNYDGSVERRLGFQYEDGFVENAITRTEEVVAGFLWKNAAGSGRNTLYVQQVGTTLYFYSYDADNPTIAGSISSGLLTTTVDLTPFHVSGSAAISPVVCQFASGRGTLFVTHPYLEPFCVEYDSTLRTVSASQIDLQIRDIDGLDDGLGVTDRPATLSAVHKYNLLNQGWTLEGITYWDVGDPGDDNKAAAGGRVDYPSDADVWWHFKDETDKFNLAWVDKVVTGNTPAPRGHYILDAFNQQRTVASGLAVDDTRVDVRPTTVAFFAGRVFYSGINASEFNTKIYFSQIISTKADYGKCYQQSDLTSEELFDLLPDDGGVIDIPEAGIIYRLWASAGVLLVFCSNGIWALAGNQGIGFTANDYSVQKIDTIGTISPESFVNVLGYPMWWNYEGIYTITPGQQGGLQVQSLTNFKISKFFSDIPPTSRKYVRGAFNNLSFTVQWLYRSVSPDTIGEAYDYDRVLNFNTLTQAWYVWDIPTSVNTVHDILVLQTADGTVSSTDVVDQSAHLVVDESGNQVIANLETIFDLFPRFKYLSSKEDSGTQWTFSETTDDTFAEWDVPDTDERSYFITGFKVHGQAQRRFQSNYVLVYSDATSETKYYIQGLWDYTTTGNSGKWSSKQLTHHDLDDRQYVKYRHKIRGTGLALQFRVSSLSGFPFHTVGWSTFETGNAGV